MKIVLAGDHAGFGYKQYLIQYLATKGIQTKDLGAFSESSVDYPDYAHPLAHGVETGEYQLGILICGSGNGVAMTANKHQNIRAALCWNEEIAKLARQHNDANVVCIPARFTSVEQAIQIVETFLNTEFEGGRHQNRVQKIKC